MELPPLNVQRISPSLLNVARLAPLSTPVHLSISSEYGVPTCISPRADAPDRDMSQDDTEPESFAKDAPEAVNLMFPHLRKPHSARLAPERFRSNSSASTAPVNDDAPEAVRQNLSFPNGTSDTSRAAPERATDSISLFGGSVTTALNAAQPLSSSLRPFASSTIRVPFFS